jgi:polar amino acid transport system substrate-binding protein
MRISRLMVRMTRRCRRPILSASGAALIILLSTFALSATAANEVAPFRVVSADLMPFAQGGHPEVPGALVELVEAMATKVGQPLKVEFYPWARAVALSNTELRVAVIPLTRSPDRERQYQWLVKLYRQRYIMLTRADRPKVESVHQARTLKKLGVLRGSVTVAYALNNGISKANLLEATSVEAGLKDLDAGITDAYLGGDAIALGTIRASGRQRSDYQIGLVLGSGDFWLAGSQGFTESDTLALRKAFDALVKDGSYDRLLKKYGVID